MGSACRHAQGTVLCPKHVALQGLCDCVLACSMLSSGVLCACQGSVQQTNLIAGKSIAMGVLHWLLQQHAAASHDAGAACASLEQDTGASILSMPCML